MAKPRPTEIKLVANLLDPDGAASEDAAQLAVEIIEALDKSRVKRDSYVVVAKLADWVPLQSWGEFSTKLQAEKFVANLSSPDGGGKAAIAKMEEPSEFNKRMGIK
jgi:hypothetical protein